MENKTIKSVLAKVTALCTAAVVSIAAVGCTVTEEKSGQTKADFSTADTQAGSQKEGNSAGAGMGRYVEKTVLEQNGYGNYYMQKLSENKLLLLSSTEGAYVSADNGETWSPDTKDWLEEFIYYNYITQAAVAKDGTMVFEYDTYTKEELDTLHGIKAEETADETQEPQELVTERPQFHNQYMLVSPEGVKTEFAINLSEDERYIRSFCFAESGRLFATVSGNKIYEIDLSDMSSRAVVSLEDYAQYVQSVGNVLLCVTYSGIVLYDLEKETFIEDAVLDKFVEENYEDLYDTGEGYPVYVFLDKDSAVYLAGRKGLHRHNIGGSMVEQIVDGNMSSLSNPAHGIRCAMAIDNQEFLIQYSDNKLVKLLYDADVPTVPNERLTVYSLETNDTIKQAIAAYQAAYPDTFVEYEVGMEADGVTREDALKNLSTELMNGSGPDVLVLDSLPAESYMDKGVLMELSDVINDIGEREELFINLLEPLKSDGELYMVPVEFQLPLIGGHESDIKSVNSYADIADVVEKLRRENAGKPILGECSADSILKRFMAVCAPAWRDETGGISQEQLKEYLVLSKRIYDAQRDSLSQDIIDQYEEQKMQYFAEVGAYAYSLYFTRINAADYLIGRIQLMFGTAGFITDAAELFSLARIKGLEDTVIKDINGQSERVYLPKTLVGINDAAANKEKAVCFLQILYGETVQDSVSYGFPMNKSAMENTYQEIDETASDKGEYLWSCMSDEEGNYVEWVIYVPDAAQRQQLYDWIAQAGTPYIPDIVLEEAVCTEGAKYLSGSQDIDVTVANIMDSAAIYTME